ncbi:hypothetical protein AAG570_001919, partial [Ranatra chinensis]
KVINRIRKFRGGRRRLRRKPRSGRPSTSSTDEKLDRVRDLLNSDRRLSVRSIADTLDIPEKIVHELVTEIMNMRKVLTDDQKIRRVAVTTELLERVEMDPDFLKIAIAGDESSFKGTRFAIQRAATRALNEVPVEAFQDAYRA